MVTSYEADISHWEAWQKEYRFGVLLILPPEPLFTQMNTLRARYDPRSQSYCDAHISLTTPLPRPLSEAHWSELKSIASIIKPFTVRYGPLMNYLPYPGICVAIESQAELDRLRTMLETASVFAGAAVRKFPFSAHLTIAEFISVEVTEALMVELKDVAPSGSFRCNGVSYMAPDRSFHFTERRKLMLSL
ncbi:2'-5' RNA ligase family protein [Candidatus Poribacteria bacterium]|nr:2'-5' RNA ligase family protein [Candidatus Poribacteria bacterium]